MLNANYGRPDTASRYVDDIPEIFPKNPSQRWKTPPCHARQSVSEALQDSLLIYRPGSRSRHHAFPDQVKSQRNWQSATVGVVPDIGKDRGGRYFIMESICDGARSPCCGAFRCAENT
jgi:hypothetical protein